MNRFVGRELRLLIFLLPRWKQRFLFYSNTGHWHAVLFRVLRRLFNQEIGQTLRKPGDAHRAADLFAVGLPRVIDERRAEVAFSDRIDFRNLDWRSRSKVKRLEADRTVGTL